MKKGEENESRGERAARLVPGQSVIVKAPKNDVLYTQFPEGVMGIILETNEDNTRMQVSVVNREGLSIPILVANDAPERENFHWYPVPAVNPLPTDPNPEPKAEE
jgi:hypothetical protein